MSLKGDILVYKYIDIALDTVCKHFYFFLYDHSGSDNHWFYLSFDPAFPVDFHSQDFVFCSFLVLFSFFCLTGHWHDG